jgi:hypothetical protein
VNPIVAIKSCWKHTERRLACRSTWLPSLPYPYKFVVGRHAPALPFGSVTDSLYGEPDVISFNVPDEFKCIGPKVVRMCQTAVECEATQLVVMDDDTYLVPGRLTALIGAMLDNGADVAAFMRQDPHYPQGAMYVLGPKAYKIIAACPWEVLAPIPDDVLVGKLLEGHNITVYHTENINPGPNWRAGVPHKRDNLVISTHKCLPADMKAVHTAWMNS